MPAIIDAPAPKAPDIVRPAVAPDAPPPAAIAPEAQPTKTTKQLIKDAYEKSAQPRQPKAEPTAEVKEQPKAKVKAVKEEVSEPKSILDQAPPVEPEPMEPPEELPEAKIKLADNASEPARKNFAELRKITDTLRQELSEKAKAEADLRKQLETLHSASPAETAEIARLREEYKAMSDKMAVLDLQEHPDFVRQFAQPIQESLAEAQEIIAYNGIEQSDLKILLGKDRKEFNAAVAELTNGMNSMDATTVQATLRQAYKLSGDAKGALSKSQELAQAFRQKSALTQKEAFEDVAKNLGPAGAFLTTIPDDPEWSPEQKAQNARYNASIAEQRTTAERYAFGALTPKEQALVAHKAAIADHLTAHLIPRAQKQYNELRDLNRQLVEQIKTLKAAKSGGQASGDTKAPSKDKAMGGSLKDMVAATYGRR